MGEGFIDPSYYRLTQFIWNDFDKFRTGPRTTPTVSATGPWTPASVQSFNGRVSPPTFFFVPPPLREATLKRKAVEEVSSDSDNELLDDSQSLEYLHDRELLPEIEVCIISEICYAFV